MDTGDTAAVAAVAAVIVGIAAGLVALAALVVSYLAWKESRRSADAAVRSAKASEDSAAAAARSAIAEEAAIELARREAEQRDADRHELAGPTFVPVGGILREHSDGGLGQFGWRGETWSADAALRVEGGPELMTLHVALVPDTSYGSIHYTLGDEGHDPLIFEVASGATITLHALPHHPVDPNDPAPLLLRITAHSQTDSAACPWVRRPRVELEAQPIPRIY